MLNYPKLITIAVICAALAVLLGLQALSSIAVRKAPAQAAALFPINGLAQEQLAFREFREDVAQGISLEEAALKASSRARKGLTTDPLAPKSYALLASAESDPAKRSAILATANKLNRRDIALQGLFLQDRLAAADYPSVISTLDQLLRVHPDYYEDFFPSLLTALKIEEAAGLYPTILTGEAPWHVEFLRQAARDDEALPNLAKIRPDIVIEDRPVDSLLITGLARIGEMDDALSLYQEKVASSVRSGEREATSWVSEYPPFDWSLTVQRDFRAQPSATGESLELYARPGQGGVMARRVVPSPQTPFSVTSELTMRASGRSEAVRMNLRCVGAQDRFLDVPFDEGDNRWLVERLPNDCAQLVIEVTGRSLRGDPTLRAEVSALVIEPI